MKKESRLNHNQHVGSRIISTLRNVKLRFGLSAFVAFLLMLAQFPLAAAGQDMLVHENVFGNLVYGRYANQGQTNVVNVVPDFSRAGYKGGGVYGTIATS